MAFELSSRDQLHTEFIEQHEVALPDVDTSRGSDAYRLGRVVSGVAWSTIAKGIGIERNLLPDQADEETLLRWANLLEIPREGASPSQGSSALRVSGTIGAAVTNGAELAHDDGTLYRVTSVGAVVGGGGTVDVDVASSSVGAITNKVTGEKLRFTTPLAGVQAEAELVQDLTGGLDVEDLERWRGRIMDALAEPPEGGAVHDYVTWAKGTSPAVKDVYVWVHRRGRGTIDVAALQAGTGADRIIVDTSAMEAAIAEKRPAGVKDVALLEVLTNAQEIVVEIDIDTSRFSWDWDDGGVATAVTGTNAGLKQVTAAGIPAGAAVGKRIQILGEQRTITARVGDVLTLDSWFGFNPGTYSVRAGGDLVEPVQAAIRALFSQLGPARGAYARLPWVDTLKLFQIVCAVGDVDGVEDLEVTTPITNLTPADSRGATVYLLVPGAVQVFKR